MKTFERLILEDSKREWNAKISVETYSLSYKQF